MEPANSREGPQLRVVFLTGGDSRSTRLSIESVCFLPGVVPVAVLVDSAHDPLRRRLKNLRKNLQRNGWRYVPYRILSAIRAFTDRLSERAVLRPGAIEALLRQAFPDRCHSLEDVGRKYGFPVRRIGNLNGPGACTALEECRADLGIVIGTRILTPRTFEIPSIGCINLHKGKVPEFRGTPPGFWELYEGIASAGVTVHFVDSKLDAGDIVETGEVPIQARETPDTLLEKLHVEGARTLARAVARIQKGAARRIPQPAAADRPRTKPTLREIAALRRRLPYWQAERDAYVILKNFIYLAIFYSGVYALIRRLRRHSRAAIILYHRVNDFSNDRLTVDTRSFAGHLLAISKYYPTMRSQDLVEAIGNGTGFSPTKVLIHFDDAYRDVYTNGGPILKVAGVPATSFVSSGFIDTERAFAHDVEKSPFLFENCRASDLREWVGHGFEVGAHTVNHVDLGACSPDQAKAEVVECQAELERVTGSPIRLFSFPFGQIHNIRREVRDQIGEAGYQALFSAHGGFVGEQTDQWDIPRFGANSMYQPLSLLMEIEGLAFVNLARRLKPAFGSAGRKPTWPTRSN